MTLAVSTHSELDKAYRAHHGRVLAFLRGALNDQDRAEDLAHDTFLTLSRKLSMGETVKNVEHYLLHIAVWKLLDELRRLTKHEAPLDELGEEAELIWPHPLLTFEDVELHATLDTELRVLPEDERQAWIATELRGLTLDEAEALLGADRATLHVRAERARRAIKAAL